MADEEALQNERVRRGVRVRGVVQGVGFRPFVCRLAQEEELTGSIGNDTDGVTIEVEGPSIKVKRFLNRLTEETPPLARIDAIDVSRLTSTGEEAEFRIVASEVVGAVSTGIPADAATCSDCLRELLDPCDRRYRYPFLNCTNCGPRFTIVRRIPYDRPQTSMAVFAMCPACQAEYDNPLDRRFHAQPNACPVCGPRVWMMQSNGAVIEAEDPIANCIEQLMQGRIVAIKGIGGFHLGVDATNEAAVRLLRERKRRHGKPFAVMVHNLNAARQICRLTAEEEAQLATTARPIVLARRREDAEIAPSVAPGLPWLGLFLPYAPLQHLLFADERIFALVMTSANLSEEPIAIDNDEARERLSGIADSFLLHNREILQRCDDSVAAVVDGVPQLIRRARGFVPLGVDLPRETPPLLAVGGHMKSVLTLARGRFAYQSQHLGDLENPLGMAFFDESLEHLMRTFEIDPQILAHDLHPGYLTTEWAKNWARNHGARLIAVQHHHAHLAACIAENRIAEPVIGLALDGTGYGTDGTVWGGEVLVSTEAGFERFAHLEWMPMPGGEAAIREPWRMALGALRTAGLTRTNADLQRLTGATAQEVALLERMMERGVNAPLTSSLGRLFDAVASVVLQRRWVDYEAQAAIELEGIAIDESDEIEPYAMRLIAPQNGGPMILSAKPLWQALISDLDNHVARPAIAARFHSGVAEGFVQAASQARLKTGIENIALSGGCLHNRRLARLLRVELESAGFTVYRHRKVSPGDGGLSYGQAVVAAAQLAEGE